MATEYVGHTGMTVGQSDDSITIMAESVEDAMDKLLGYAEDQWPESDGPYDAWCWIESKDGAVLATEQVEITEDGFRSPPC